jgi:hypothetical protein
VVVVRRLRERPPEEVVDGKWDFVELACVHDGRRSFESEFLLSPLHQ